MVRRVTAEGGWREMSLLRSRFGDQTIRDVIERTEARGLGPQGAPVRLHREALGRSQRSLLPHLAPLAQRQGFHLAGGTALALQLGRRRSLDSTGSARTRSTIRFASLPTCEPRPSAARRIASRGARGTLHARASGVRVSFLEYGYPLLRPLREIEGVRLAALEDRPRPQQHTSIAQPTVVLVA